MDNIQFKKNYSAFVEPAYAAQLSRTKAPAQAKDGGKTDFSELLQKNIRANDARLTFSKHAMQRADSRQIELSPQLIAKMGDAVEKAQDKGIKEALILNGQNAFIVNVPNRTVVTAMSGGEMKENVFTNIDGAVVL